MFCFQNLAQIKSYSIKSCAVDYYKIMWRFAEKCQFHSSLFVPAINIESRHLVITWRRLQQRIIKYVVLEFAVQNIVKIALQYTTH